MNQSSLEAQLEELLSESIDSVINREQSTFDRLAAPFNKSLVLFGAGGLGKKTLAGLRRLGIEPLAFADNNPVLWGAQVNGVQVMSPLAAAEKYGQSAAFVITIWKGEAVDRMAERKQQLIDLNCSRIVSFGHLFWKYPEVFLPHYGFDLPRNLCQQANDIRKAFAMWEDEESRREYLAQIKWRMLLDFDGLPSPVEHEIYFPGDLFDLIPNEVFVDCGAFDGDTLRSFLENSSTSFAKIVAFEPDQANFQQLHAYVSTLSRDISSRIVIHQLAVGERRGRVLFDATGTEGSAVGSGSFEVDCASLDEILVDCIPTFVKMDIEGSELDALMGARNTIERFAPVLAVCAYHAQNHAWRIPLLIQSMSDKYKFFLRPHLLEVWDLVCYAIPKDRLTIAV